MTAPVLDESDGALAQDPVAALRARALADARRLHALARMARTDGLPKPDLRAANARAAARGVLRHARRLSALSAPRGGGTRPAAMAE